MKRKTVFTVAAFLAFITILVVYVEYGRIQECLRVKEKTQAAVDSASRISFEKGRLCGKKEQSIADSSATASRNARMAVKPPVKRPKPAVPAPVNYVMNGDSIALDGKGNPITRKTE